MTTASQRRARNRRRPDSVLPRRRREPVAPSRRSRLVGLPLLSVVAAAAGALLILIAVVTGGRAQPTQGPASPGVAVAGRFSGLPAAGYVLGRADAPVTIDLYEDFQCPACRHWGQAVFPALAANELASGRAKLVFHDFAFLGPESVTAAQGAYAAARQGRFWDYWAALYANQGPENGGSITPARLTALAIDLGMDGPRFGSDMGSQKAATVVGASIADARRLGIDSTPTLIVDGRRLVGASYAELSSAIADAAAK